MPVPSNEEQLLVTIRLAQLKQARDGCVENLAKLREQKHGLMHDLLSGRVRVKVDGG